MTYRVASDLEGSIFTGNRPKAFLPHLVCSWTLDPASHRLSCAWAAPIERWDITFLSSGMTSGSVSRRTRLAQPHLG
jgi:hypothetical protein